MQSVKVMPKSAQTSPDPARDWAALYQLCQTYEQKLKDAAQSQVSGAVTVDCLHPYACVQQSVKSFYVVLAVVTIHYVT